jgi:hypothetical protein
MHGFAAFRRAELFLACVVVCRIESDGLAMSDIYIIEVGSQAAGIVVRDREGYRFFAASHRFNPIEGQMFRNAREAERAAIRLANGGLLVA